MTGSGQWVRTDIDFGNRLAWVWITGRLAAAHGLSLSRLMTEGSPEQLEKILYDFIDELRPEWCGCTIFAIKYDLAPMRWKILVAHKSFTSLADGHTFPEIPLVDDGTVILQPNPPLS